MFWLIKQVLLVLLRFKCVSLNNELCMATPTLIELNSVEFNYYPFMISLDNSNGSCNTVNDVYRKICFPSKANDVSVKLFNMITD